MLQLYYRVARLLLLPAKAGKAYLKGCDQLLTIATAAEYAMQPDNTASLYFIVSNTKFTKLASDQVQVLNS